MAKRTDCLAWEDYFMSVALLAAKRSKDPATQVGACIIDSENRILAVGYNGFPRKCDDDAFPWGKDENNPLNNKYMYVVHAEANAILNKNSADVCGARLYSTLFPCNECTKLIIQSGIKEVVYISNKYSKKPNFIASQKMLDAAGIPCRRYIPVRQKVVLDFTELVEDDIDGAINGLKIDE